MMAKKERETAESALHDADVSFSTALRRVTGRLKGRGRKAALTALYDLESEFKKEIGLEED
jgi:hypothetical protein